MEIKKKKYRYVLLILIITISLEAYLRIYWGFCDALLYNHNEKYEYIAQPNQNRYRFRCHIKYNSYSQRCDEPDTTKTIILGLGDSVLFGGTWMDQDSLATSIISNTTNFQILNISSGSWGPDNCSAYLEEYGTFNAKAMILVCSSHDAYDTMTHEKVVGVYPNYPDKESPLALYELVNRYLFPQIIKFFNKYKSKFDPDEEVINNSQPDAYIVRKTNIFNPGFNQLKTIAKNNNIPLYIFLHAEKKEIENGKYNEMGQEIIAWANENHVPIIKGLDNGESLLLLKDKIHYNTKGQKFLSKQLLLILKHIKR